MKEYKKDQGFTLIEVLASLTILTLIALPMFSFFTQAYDYTTKNQNNTVGVNVARGVVEFMKKQNFEEMKNLLEATGQPDPSNGLKKTEIYIGTTTNSYYYSETEVPETNQIEINSNRYRVSVTLWKNSDSHLDAYSIPINVTASWGMNSNNEMKTSLEGAIINETIR